ncbi:Glyoxalase/bleomycin resistance protein/dioxygenase [Kribbella flavida DSM 17836]|uniref:Glyoxalase/bleomycin resistance protein/dioxygenase n=1 Tax=Kribbella flavida (strain DSM 17836 / JCM 10339 / NBRC 14399) TaxID=479435 RepID=D2PRK0_KRIFD|nr:glyoxalase superfamily protein [Kribbella flavida]ADB34918.1 Glyoxalase/bleomycin resistance protein/dioxygenase [Kribbella flavida DSM 17836]
MRTFRDAKTMAKTLRAELLARRQVELGHSEALEIVARQFGHADWNVMAAKARQLAGVDGDGSTGVGGNPTIPVLRIFDVAQARRFFVDFLGCRLDFGGPSDGADGPFYGQVTRAGSTFHLTETPYVASPGATIGIWLPNLDDLHAELDAQRTQVEVFGPAVWVPRPEDAGWARVMAVNDPFGNMLRFCQPPDAGHLPRW